MNTKLTLSIDAKIVEKAKGYSRANGRSLSKLIENYLRSITFENNSEIEEADPPEFIKKWHGAFKNNDEKEYKQLVTNEIVKKLTKL